MNYEQLAIDKLVQGLKGASGYDCAAALLKHARHAGPEGDFEIKLGLLSGHEFSVFVTTVAAAKMIVEVFYDCDPMIYIDESSIATYTPELNV